MTHTDDTKQNAALRHALGMLLDATGDLDAAIDGVTDQFDDEREQLEAACQNARAVLQSAACVNADERPVGRREIALGWSIEDVQEVRPDLTDSQAWEVLQEVECRHDATIGVTWYTLEFFAEELFGPTPEIDSQK